MRIRALTYNIHKCVGPLDRRYDPVRIYETIAHYEPDLVLLQEVAQHGKHFAGEVQIERLGELLGLRHRTYFVNVRRAIRGEYGNAILSRFPLMEAVNVDITVGKKIARSVLHGKFRIRLPRGRSRTLHVFNMHLGLGERERRKQLRQFLECEPFAGLDARTPVLIGGDFNDLLGSLGKLLTPAGFRGVERPVRTFPAFAPLRALDSLYVRGDLRFESVFASRLAMAKRASDHLPLITDLELTSGPQRHRNAGRQRAH